MDVAQEKKVIKLKFPSQLKQYVGNEKEITVSAETVDEVFQHLESHYGGLYERLLFDDGTLRPYINVFVGKKNIREQEGVHTRISNGDTVSILLPRAGG